jgi:uncharacterized membrane protein
MQPPNQPPNQPPQGPPSGQQPPGEPPQGTPPGQQPPPAAYTPPPPHQDPDATGPGYLDVGDLLRTTAQTIGANFVSFLAIAAICLSPAMLVSLVMLMNMDVGAMMEAAAAGEGSEGIVGMEQALTNAGVGLLEMLLTFIAQAAVMFTTVEHLAGRHASTGAALHKALMRIVPVVLTSILTALVIGFGLILCIVPGILFALMFYVAVPVSVAENCSALEAMKRSETLTSGHKGTLFLVSLILLGVFMAIGCVVGMGGIGAVAASPGVGMYFGWGIDWVVTILQTMASAALAAVVYVRLRGVREGVDIESLASVFS